MNRLAASVIKEARVLWRDREGLAILFAMPLVFVVIMSLALQDFFRPKSAARFDVVVLDEEGPGNAPTLAQRIEAALQGIAGVRVERLVPGQQTPSTPDVVQAVRRGTYQFALIVPRGVGERLTVQLRTRDPRHVATSPAEPRSSHDTNDRIELDFIADPGLRADQRALVRGALERALLALEIEQTVREIAGPSAPSMRSVLTLRDRPAGDAVTMPTSTQQNVPAYSLLAIFMLVVPLSTTFIKERDQGTLHRLRTMPVRTSTLIAAKIVPYFVINLLQMAFCVAIGRWLIPFLGGEALTLTGAMIGPIVLLSAAASLAAIGFALLIAMLARTPEQATAFGAAAVLLMAALGGIMVPKLLMPAGLQQVALASPMGWALDGFLDIFLRDAGLSDVLLPAVALSAFALACLGLALRRFDAIMRTA